MYLDSLNSNDLPRHVPRHFISMEEPKVITIDDVIDSTVMHINKGNPLFARESKGNAHGTQGERSNGDNSQHHLLLIDR